jgi:hypothetical protein
MWPTEEAKAGAFAYAGHQGGKGWSLRLRGLPRRQRLEPSLTRATKEAKAGAFAYDVLRWEWRVIEGKSSIPQLDELACIAHKS